MATEDRQSLRHELDFVFYDLPSTAEVRLDLSGDADAELVLRASAPAFVLGAPYNNDPMEVRSLALAPRRLQFLAVNPPPELPLKLQIVSPSPFVFGWLQLPESAQVMVMSPVERIRFVGPGYWVIPLRPCDAPAPQRARTPSPSPAPAPAPAPAASPSRPKAAPAPPSRSPSPAAKPAAVPPPP